MDRSIQPSQNVSFKYNQESLWINGKELSLTNISFLNMQKPLTIRAKNPTKMKVKALPLQTSCILRWKPCIWIGWVQWLLLYARDRIHQIYLFWLQTEKLENKIIIIQKGYKYIKYTIATLSKEVLAFHDTSTNVNTYSEKKEEIISFSQKLKLKSVE